jgi:hypothetical protein
MHVSDLKHFTKDAGQTGENVARTLRVIAFVLLNWSHSQSLRNAENIRSKRKLSKSVEGSGVEQFDSKEKLPPLPVIYFDKLTTFVCRLWDQLCELDKVRYRSALLQHRGFHGPGRCIKINRTAEEEINLGNDPNDTRRSQWAFITEIVEKLKPALSDARMLFKLTGKAWDIKCKVYPTLEKSVWASWIYDVDSEEVGPKFLTLSEMNCVNNIALAVAELEDEEIRAIGTHCCASDTQKDISFNLDAWIKNFDIFVESLRSQDNDKAALSAYKLVTISREVRRKSKDNKEVYETAVKKIIKFFEKPSCVPEIRKAFQTIQRPANEIWEDAFIAATGKGVQNIIDLSIYCRYGLSMKTGLELTLRENTEAKEAYTRLHAFMGRHYINLPSYDKLLSVSETMWANTLEGIMDKVLECVPRMRRNCGVP